MAKQRKVKIAFRATEQMKTYDDRPSPWTHGTIRSVEEDRAKHLIETFPKQFFPQGKFKEIVEAEQAKAEAAARAEYEDKFGKPPDDSGDGPTLDPKIAEQLDKAEVDLWRAAATKADAGQDLTEDELAIIEKVDKLLEG